ncbi:MAG: DUF4373 domain-containing protein [Marinilabiliaceae bacterium]|nr:DUF4373 domain-containing protein [Marinilabiliaceae bacterium]
MAKDAYFFPHDSNAKDDPKMMFLIDQLGLEGYGIFWVLIEMLREQQEYKAPLAILPIIARKYSTQHEKIKAVVFGYDLFKIEDEKFFFSKSLIDRLSLMDAKKQRRIDAGKKAISARWNKQPALPENSNSNTNVLPTEYERNTNVEKKEYDSIALDYTILDNTILDNTKLNDTKQDNTISIVRPMVDELMQYFNFNEQNHFSHLRTITHFCTTLMRTGMMEHFNTQFAAYNQYKTITGQVRHGFRSFLGSPDQNYTDGGWNAENWIDKLATVQPSHIAQGEYNVSDQMKRIADQLKSSL